ncbi:MAG: NAD(P)/FAD-dependent oxidoreductase [Acidimicrobiales bacterium]
MQQPGPLDHVVVVGASLAGLRACEALRAGGFTGAITLVGAEPHPPYDRPPLSKQLLAGAWDVERVWLRPPDSAGDLGVTTRFGVPASGLDAEAGAVVLADGSEVAFDGLIIATGSQPHRLPRQLETANVYELRTLDDSLALRDVIHRPGTRLVVVGAGFIGLEVAATARRAGCDVTVVEAADAPLIRGVGPLLGPTVAAMHDDEGVAIRCGVTVSELRPDGLRLADGTAIAADATVVGIGVAPATSWLDASGLRLDDGVVTAPTLSVGVPRIYAAGDVARCVNTCFGEEMRVEHWTNADEQGGLAARNLLAEVDGELAEDFASIPYVWSDQYDHRVQVLGCTVAPDGAPADPHVVVGSPGQRRFLALFEAGGLLRGVLALDLPRLMMKYRSLIQRQASIDHALALAAEQQAALKP